MGSENVFNYVQLGAQAGTFAAPGAAVAATVLYPVEAPITFELERGSAIAKQDRGRNVRNSAGAGYHGVRRASATLPAQARFEDLMDILEMHAEGGIAATGVGPYVWTYVLKADSAGAISLKPHTIEGGNGDAAQSQQRLRSALVNSLTLGFSDLAAGQAAPWTLSAEMVAIDREINALTAALAPRTGLEVIQGQYSRLYEGTTATAFAALVELAGSLKSFTMTTNRNLTLRAYGSASDLATGFGFSDQTNGTFEAKVAVSATSKSDFHDIWNVATPAPLGERRWRVKTAGSGTKDLTIDMRTAILAVPYDEVDGERLFRVTGEFVDDDTLNGPVQWAITNSIATL